MTAIVSALSIISAWASSTHAQTDLRIENCMKEAVETAQNAYLKLMTAKTGYEDPSGDGLYQRQFYAKKGLDPEAGLIVVMPLSRWGTLVGFKMNYSGRMAPDKDKYHIIYELDLNSRNKCSFRPIRPRLDIVVYSSSIDLHELSDFTEYGSYRFKFE